MNVRRGRAIQIEDARGHGFVRPPGQSERVVVAQVEALVDLSHGLEWRLVDRLEIRLTLAGRLPYFGVLMPPDVGVDAVGDISGPCSKKITAGRRDSVGEQRSPVVAHEINRGIELLQLSDEPRCVIVFGGSESRWARAAKSGKRERDRLFVDLRAHLVPQRGCLRSEEHTSELQSLRHLVCRLLLE